VSTTHHPLLTTVLLPKVTKRHERNEELPTEHTDYTEESDKKEAKVQSGLAVFCQFSWKQHSTCNIEHPTPARVKRRSLVKIGLTPKMTWGVTWIHYDGKTTTKGLERRER
jgi:hypothetical protein